MSHHNDLRREFASFIATCATVAFVFGCVIGAAVAKMGFCG